MGARQKARGTGDRGSLIPLVPAGAGAYPVSGGLPLHPDRESTMSKRKRQFYIHATAVAKEHFLQPSLEKMARSFFKRHSIACVKACIPEPVRSAVNKAFFAGVKSDGNDVHLFIDDDYERLTSAVLEMFPDCHVWARPVAAV